MKSLINCKRLRLAAGNQWILDNKSVFEIARSKIAKLLRRQAFAFLRFHTIIRHSDQCLMYRMANDHDPLDIPV